MRVICVENYEQMSEVACNHLIGFMNGSKRMNISITAGSTPVRLYERLVPYVKMYKEQFKHIHYYNFDEIPYRLENREGVTISNLRNMYFNPAHIDESQIHILDHKNYLQQDERIEADGGLDLVVLGLGTDGHFCGNLPNTTKFGDLTTRVNCDDELKERLLGEFNGHHDDVPDYYVTMGPRSIMQAKNIVMIVSGKHKATAVKALLSLEVDENIPATLLTLHPNFTLIVDQDALS